MTTDPEQQRHSRNLLLVLAACVGTVATCGIVYQLVIGTISTYLLGNSTFQFSLTIGLFMSAYGVGSFLSTRIHDRLVQWFAVTEIALGFCGGAASFVLFYLYATTDLFQAGRALLIGVIGTLIGLEIPLLVRISEEHRHNLRITVGQMMGFDYIGALVGGIAFPLVLLPAWGLLGSSFLVGLANLAVAVVTILAFRNIVQRRGLLLGAAALVALGLGLAMVKDHDVEHWVEQSMYDDPLVYLQQTPYQRIAVTDRDNDLRLYLDGSLQFSSTDEYRYHETLIHPGATRLDQMHDVLILGGGDGLALRELSHYPEIQTVTLVDLDPAVVRLGKTLPQLVALNKHSFARMHPKVLHKDAFTFMQRTNRSWDFIVVDLPDPHGESLAKLYSVAFYRSIAHHLRPHGLMVAQIGSPFFSRKTYWTSVKTMQTAGLHPVPYHVQVPAFGEWGFALGGRSIPTAPKRKFVGRFYDTSDDAMLFHFPRDMRQPNDLKPNTLIRPIIVSLYRKDWRHWD